MCVQRRNACVNCGRPLIVIEFDTGNCRVNKIYTTARKIISILWMIWFCATKNFICKFIYKIIGNPPILKMGWKTRCGIHSYYEFARLVWVWVHGSFYATWTMRFYCTFTIHRLRNEVIWLWDVYYAVQLVLYHIGIHYGFICYGQDRMGLK